MRLENLSGKKYGRLMVLDNHIKRGKKTFWQCRCECGTIKFIEAYNLKCENSTSCGCKKRELTSQRSKIHGMSETKLYYIYKGMKNRCNNPETKYYYNYGGRGISICDEWLGDFNKFQQWSMANGYKEGLTIDRINNNGNYEPNNCRWISLKEQQYNKRDNIHVLVDGVFYSPTQLSKIYGINIKTIYDRYYRGKRGKQLID